MKSVVWTYVNEELVFHELDKYYVLKTKRQLDKLVDKLLDIDAVMTPAVIDFPVVLELKNGFGPTLTRVDPKKLKKDIKYLQGLLKEIK